MEEETERAETAQTTEAINKSIYRTLLLGNLFLFFGFSLWRSMFNNFAVEELGIRANQIGLIQSFREVPGLLGFLAGVLALYITEMSLISASLVVMGIGLIMVGYSEGLVMLTVGTVVMSIGFHFFVPNSSSLVLMVSEESKAAGALGKLRSISAFSMVLAAGTIFALKELLGYRWLFLGGGFVVIGCGIATFFQKKVRARVGSTRKVVFRRRYLLYYVLAFLMGSRRHIFTTFAIFLLVSTYAVDVKTVAILFLVNSVVATYAYQKFGKLIDRFGERLVLSYNFTLLTFVFLGYAYIHFVPLLFLLFVVDNVLFGFNIAADTYLRKIAPSDEVTSNISMGMTMNHLSAVIMPVCGGLIWEAYGSETTFAAGAAITVLSLVVVQKIK